MYRPEIRPLAGQTYERDGLRREVLDSSPRGPGWDVRRPGSDACWIAWCATWARWVSGATLVSGPERRGR